MPESLISLVEQGIIEEVLRPLMSGKEANVYLVVSKGQQYVAKVYKEANNRTFKHRVEYTEGRQIRNTRDQRAISKNSAYGRSKQESGWRDVEADVIYRLRDLGVRVPEPRAYVDNVLVMELVTDKKGKPAPRLADMTLPKDQAEELFERLIREVLKMLCAGIVHGNLSEFNILAGAKGTVIIDFPQAVEASTNLNARKLLVRDVNNLTRFFGRFSRKLRSLKYGEEMWEGYQRGELTPDTVLTGHFSPPKKTVEVSSLLEEIQEIERENIARREALGLPPARPARRPAPPPAEKPKTEAKGKAEQKPNRHRRRRKPKPKAEQRVEANRPGTASPPANPRRRNRRRRHPGPGGAPSCPAPKPRPLQKH